MPSQLLARLNRFLDPQQATTINALEHTPRNDVLGPPPPPNPAQPGEPRPNTNPHWPAGSFGSVLHNVQCVMIHETSGWPSYQSAINFRQLYRSLDSHAWVEHPAPPHWVDRRGIGPQYFVDANGTAFALIGPENLDGDPEETWHGEWMNTFALGIENADIGDSGVTPGNGLGPRWWRLSDRPADLTGMKVYLVLHPHGDEDATLIWIAQFPAFAGSGDIVDGAHPDHDRRLARNPGWDNMLFTERDYRTLVLLCRLLAEQNGLPRNFPLLPYVDDSADHGDPAVFRQLILADQRRDAIALKLGTTTADIQANGAAYTHFYNPNSLRIWNRFFGVNPANPGPADLPCFRGFLSHDINGGHPCPGPLFDWHRFAREVWDWWWYPFDTTSVGVITDARPYLQARRNTQLIDYYWDAVGAAVDYDALHPPAGLTDPFHQRYALPLMAPVYAMANGVVVAARFALSNDPAASGFVLTRHEVFQQVRARDRINYDQAPTFVWSLIYYLGNPGFSLDGIGGANPDWLNRFVMRLKECELAVAFHAANSGAAAPNAALRTALDHGWSHNPTGNGPRLSTGQEIERDAAAYRAIANDLAAGRHALFPLEANPAPTPVRVILGDYLGQPNRMPENHDGIQVAIFSTVQLDVPGAAQRQVSASGEAWWTAAAAALRHEAAAEMDLPANGMAWHYGLTDFLAWINGLTWKSEWAKYGVVDAAGQPAPAPARPISRRVS